MAGSRGTGEDQSTDTSKKIGILLVYVMELKEVGKRSRETAFVADSDT